MQKHIDHTDLKNEVIDKWENDAVEYFTSENTGFTAPNPTHFETFIKPDYQVILDDPMACIAELGFDSMSAYIAAKREEKHD